MSAFPKDTFKKNNFYRGGTARAVAGSKVYENVCLPLPLLLTSPHHHSSPPLPPPYRSSSSVVTLVFDKSNLRVSFSPCGCGAVPRRSNNIPVCPPPPRDLRRDPGVLYDRTDEFSPPPLRSRGKSFSRKTRRIRPDNMCVRWCARRYKSCANSTHICLLVTAAAAADRTHRTGKSVRVPSGKKTPRGGSAVR